jgi:hypothetical protein
VVYEQVSNSVRRRGDKVWLGRLTLRLVGWPNIETGHCRSGRARWDLKHLALRLGTSGGLKAKFDGYWSGTYGRALTILHAPPPKSLGLP